MEKHIFLYKSIGLDPKIKKANIPASNLYDIMLVWIVYVSTCQSNCTMVTYITNQLFLLSRSYKGQLKVKRKYCIRSIQLGLFYLYMVIGLMGNIFRVISSMSSISRHVQYDVCKCSSLNIHDLIKSN